MINHSAYIGQNVSIGENVIIEANVIIGDHVHIGHHSVIYQDTIIGNNVTIGSFTSLGKAPSRNKNMIQGTNKKLEPLLISNDVQIGEHCVIYRGTNLFEGVFVGDLASIREYVKVNQDSVIGRNVMIESHTNLGERVTIQTGSYITAHMDIENDVFIGPCCSTSNDKHMKSHGKSLKGPTIQEGAKIGNNATLLPAIVIGKHAIVGAGTTVVHDVSPFTTVIGTAENKTQ